MIRAVEICDTYGDGRWLRRWSLVVGHARCVADAYEVAATDPAVLGAQVAANAEVRAAMAAVEAYEAALATATQDEPPVGDPAREAWSAARAAVAAADPDTVALHQARHPDATTG